MAIDGCSVQTAYNMQETRRGNYTQFGGVHPLLPVPTGKTMCLAGLSNIRDLTEPSW